ncbi:MAG TPA: GAF domain-containing protein [Stellaceae bacterium]|nr:GAF domain-containing protein [Stellaceae bacterium]
MRVRFWGTRGSIPRPGSTTIRYGGNTSCVEVRSAAGTNIVLDCGTGALSLGADLLRRGESPLRGHLLISHTHWDHIQGLPFFVPLFMPGNEWDIYAPHGFLQSVRETLAGQMQHTYFPVDLEQLGATIRYHNLTEGGFTVGDVSIRSRYLNHPALTLGYRLEADGVSLVYCCDHEPHSRPLAYGAGEVGDQDRAHIEFIAGADLLIHDAQYRAPEYEGKIGWGHSTLEYVTAIAQIAEVKSLAFTHHDPSRDDDTIDREVVQVREMLRAAGATLDVCAAAEGLAIDLRSLPGHIHKPLHDEFAAEISTPPQQVDESALLGIADTALYDEFWRVLHADGVRVSHAANGPAAVEMARTGSPSVIVLDRYLPGDGLEVCRAIRNSGEPGAKDVPIIITAAQEEVGAGMNAGVTDWLVKPFSDIYMRTRLRAWLMRVNCRWVQPRRSNDELQRLAALRDLAILDTEPEERFDRITRIAAATFDVPVALVSLIDEDRQWFKSACGFPAGEMPRDVSFCAHAILERDVMVVPDTLLDARFADSPVVVGGPRVRFYAGCPLMLDNGACVGTLCIVDTRPRDFDVPAIRILEDLAKLVLQELQRKP